MVMEYSGTNKQALSPESAAAGDLFDLFANAQTFKCVQGTFRLLCDTLHLKPTTFPCFYPKLKAKLRSWKAQAIWSKFDKRASHRCYNRGKACANVKVLIIGAGPCGLRAAIEAQLLGAKVVVIEKRDRFSRNNVLHLWPFVIQDLRNLGAKKFYGKFCVGAIDHISIRQLQCVLLKVALLLGVEVHENVAFDDLIEPPVDQSEEKIGWKVLVTPRDHPLSFYEFDVLIGADGKRNTLKGFKRKEFRGKLAIAITANFINRHSEAEACVQEISGVAFIFNQKFFQDLRDHTGIDLENIVYYKDETHYFVMTAKKSSLIEKGVILNDYADTARLLALENVNKEALFNYAREAADFSTDFQMPNLDFAVNHYGQEDVAMFDFTSMYAAESACRVVERRGHRLLQALVGDSLLEPFWPTGSGCARGFLSSMDTCWMIRSWALGTMMPLQILAERESVFRLLAQTTPENLSKDYNDYSLNPASRYPNLNFNAVRPVQVQNLYDTDCELKKEVLHVVELPKKRRKKDSLMHPDTLLNWCQQQVMSYQNVNIENMTTSWTNGLAFAAILHHYRPDLIDFHLLTAEEAEKNIQLAFEICEREFGIHPVLTAKEIAESSTIDTLAMVSYVSQIYETFRGEIPHIAHTSVVDFSHEDNLVSPIRKSTIARLSLLSRLGQRLPGGSKKRTSMDRNERRQDAEQDKELERERADILRRMKKRRSMERDRALFIMNKDIQQATLPAYQKTISSFEDRENFTTRIRDLEEKLYGVGQPTIKLKSPNAPRVIGKLHRGDWNVRMLEEKLKGQKPSPKKERHDVPKWNRDMFEDKLRALDQKGKGECLDEPAKYSTFDSCLQMLDKKLKDGSNLDIGQRGSNKVSSVAGQLASILGSNSDVNHWSGPHSSETCHFCNKRVYLMEQQNAQGKFFHRSCFKCECCGVTLRLSSYGLGTVGHYSGRFLCLLHSGMRNPPQSLQSDEKTNAGKIISTRAGLIAREMPTSLDLPDVCSNKTRGVTPERVEFENTFEFTSEEELLSEIDEDEWTDRNFGMSANENESSNDESDFSSDEITSENEDELQEAFEKSLTAGETLKLAETWKRRYFKRKSTPTESCSDEEWQGTDDIEHCDESEEEYSYEEYDNEDDDESTETEGEIHNIASVFPCEDVVLTPNECKTRNKDDHNIPQPLASNANSQFVDYIALKSSETDDTASGGFDSEQFTDSETETKSEGTPEGDADDEDEDQNRNGIHRDDCESPQGICCSTIPTIIINETSTNAPHEDDEAYFVTLQEQSLIAERALESLIIDGHSTLLQKSVINTTEESHSIQEERLKKDKIDHETVSQVILKNDSGWKSSANNILGNESEALELNKSDKHGDTSVKHETIMSKSDSCACDVTTLMKMHGEIEKEATNLVTDDVYSNLEQSKPKNETKVVQQPAVLESCTSKMMLKLKEQYLLGCADNLNKQELVTDFSYASRDSNSGTNLNTLEPAVKSCLELVNEKQKMLSQSTSSTESSDVWFRGLTVDISPMSPSSIHSVSPFSIVQQLPFSTEAFQQNGIENCLSPFHITNQDGLKSFTESEDVSNEVRDQSPDLFEDPLATTTFNFGATVNSNTSKLSTKCQSIITDFSNVSEKVENIDTADATIMTKVEQSKITDVTQATEQKENLPETNVRNNIAEDEIAFADPLCCLNQGGSLIVDTSKVTIRKKKAFQPSDNCQLLEQDHYHAMNENFKTSIENSSIGDDISQGLIFQDKFEINDKFLSSVTANELHESIESYDLPLIDQGKQIKNENVIILSKKGVNLAMPEDDDSLINISSSSESDKVPNLDENVYNIQHIETKTGSKIAGYAGFSEKNFPFKEYGQKSSKKYFDTPLLFPSKFNDVDSLVVESKTESLALSSDIERQVYLDEENISCSNTCNYLEEIPFADDEPAPNLSSLNPDKDNFFKEQQKFKKSLQRPLSMVEALLCSTPIMTRESSEQCMLPDTSITNSGMFSTPKTMKEAVDDLRQIRTVEREKARQEARERARLKSDEELGLREIDYTGLKKRYHKIDEKLGFNVEEETGPFSFLTNEDNCCTEEIQINTSCKQPCIHSSSSPDSEVFDQDNEIGSSSLTTMLENISNEQGEINKKEISDLHPNSPDDTKSISVSSNPPSGNDITMSESSTSMTSKTDHPSSYLEPDISVEEVGFSVAVESGNVAVLRSNSKKNVHKRKRFLSLFSNLGKVKDKWEKKNKEKSSTSTSSSSSPHGASIKETPIENAVLTFAATQLKCDSMPKECRFPKLHLSRSKEKLKEEEYKLKSLKGRCSTPQTSSSTTNLNDAESRSQNISHSPHSGDIILDRHTLIASMASLSRQIPQLEKNENGVAPDVLGNIVLRESQGSLFGDSKKTKDLTEDRKKKFQKIAQKVYRQQEQKRLRMAQEIQRQLEELEVKQRDMEIKGVQVEKALHGEGDLASNEEGKLMQQWFQLIHAKNLLVRQEQELMVKAKELELEDRHSRLQHTLHLLMTVEDLKKTPSEIEEEGQILTEMLEIVEQRDNLVALLEKNRVIQEEEDKDLELTMQAKGMNLLLALPI